VTRKRIRGLRRHFRAHQQQALLPALLDKTRLTGFQVDYQQLGLAPWYTHQKPPTRFRQLWVGRLVRDFYHWQVQLKERYSDFYLAVWLFEPRFGHSQLVTAIEERKAHYEQLFMHWAGARVHPSRELPPEYQALPGVLDLHWTSYPDVELLLPDEFAEQRAWVAKKPHWPGETVDGEPYIAVQVGWVWVGQQNN
jgi:hypothetical protein